MLLNDLLSNDDSSSPASAAARNNARQAQDVDEPHVPDGVEELVAVSAVVIASALVRLVVIVVVRVVGVPVAEAALLVGRAVVVIGAFVLVGVAVGIQTCFVFRGDTVRRLGCVVSRGVGWCGDVLRHSISISGIGHSAPL